MNKLVKSLYIIGFIATIIGIAVILLANLALSDYPKSISLITGVVILMVAKFVELHIYKSQKHDLNRFNILGYIIGFLLLVVGLIFFKISLIIVGEIFLSVAIIMEKNQKVYANNTQNSYKIGLPCIMIGTIISDLSRWCIPWEMGLIGYSLIIIGIICIAKSKLSNSNKKRQVVTYYQPHSSHSSSQSNPKCPTCGSSNVHPISTGKRIAGAIMMGVFDSSFGKSYECDDCRYKW